MDRLWGFKKAWYYRMSLKRIQEKASGNPENLIFQVRLGDFLAKLNKKKEAIEIYERAAQQFLQKNLYLHAIALQKIIMRTNPVRDNGEQSLMLAGLYEEMLKHNEKHWETGPGTPPENHPKAEPESSRLSEKGGVVMRLEPRATAWLLF